ncbi:MAG: hypothetical protein ACRDPE_15760 [Solirubrobacterales bacterium]
MANNNRRQAIAKAIIARSPSSARNGGTTAPRAAAKSQTTGLSPNRAVSAPAGLVKPKNFNNEWSVFKASSPAPSPAPAAPASSPAPESAMPWSSKYDQTVDEARKKYLNTINDINLNEQTSKQEYGLDSGFNDYKANPYSRAALLEKSYETANRGTTNSAGIQLYSGSTSNRLGANRSTRDLNYNNLRGEYQNTLNELNAGRTRAAEAEHETEQEAYWNRIREAEEHEPVAEAAPADSGGGEDGESTGGGGGGGSSGNKRKKKPTNNRSAQTKNAISNNRKAR